MATRTKRAASGKKLLALHDPPIIEIRGQSVMLDVDLAAAYGVTTAILNQAVKRNAARFPADFRFQVSREEFANLMSQFVTSSSGHGGRRKLPWFTRSMAR